MWEELNLPQVTRISAVLQTPSVIKGIASRCFGSVPDPSIQLLDNAYIRLAILQRSERDVEPWRCSRNKGSNRGVWVRRCPSYMKLVALLQYSPKLLLGLAMMW